MNSGGSLFSRTASLQDNGVQSFFSVHRLLSGLAQAGIYSKMLTTVVLLVSPQSNVNLEARCNLIFRTL